MLKSILLNLKSPICLALFCMMLDSLSFGLAMPVMPDLLVDLGCGSISDAAFYGGLLSAAFSLMQLVFGPLMGNLSDRFGRWPIMLVSLVVLLVDYVIKGFAHSMWLLFFGRIICGIGLAHYSTASAIISDTSTIKDRAKNFGMLGTAIGSGFILGALIGGLLPNFGSRAPFYAAAVLSTGNLIFCLFFLKESLSLKNKRPFSWSRAHPLGALKAIVAIPGLSRMLLVLFFYEIAFNVYQATWAYFTKLKFGWDASTIGISLGLFGVMAALMQGCAIRFFLSRLGEYKTAAFALVINVFVFLVFAVVSQSWMMFALIPLMALGTIFLPAVQSILTRFVRSDFHGELQGSVTSVRALSITIGPPLMAGLFSLFTAEGGSFIFPGAAFLLAMLIAAISLTIFLGAREKEHKKIHQECF